MNPFILPNLTQIIGFVIQRGTFKSSIPGREYDSGNKLYNNMMFNVRVLAAEPKAHPFSEQDQRV
jgi:hypothetical protein